ncbi:MAG TPA: fasciclin domain-containing protein [Fodinibius sp.]|nr:fasciclin domain-containing protein [Fodinibius sp.]
MGNLLEEAENYTDFETFLEHLSTTELDSTIANEEDRFTVLVPVNEAFSGVPDSANIDSLILSYHIINEEVDLNTLEAGAEERFQSLQGEDVFFVIGEDSLYINGSNYLGGVRAINGVIYATNRVLFPDSHLNVSGLISKRYQLNVLDDAIDEAGLSSVLEDPASAYTVFAPSDEALGDTDLSAEDVQYHIIEQKLLSSDLGSQTYTTLNGQELTVDVNGTITVNGDATVTTEDIEGTNGVIHIIDAPLTGSGEE